MSTIFPQEYLQNLDSLIFVHNKQLVSSLDREATGSLGTFTTPPYMKDDYPRGIGKYPTVPICMETRNATHQF
jgi:hypothetical protein